MTNKIAEVGSETYHQSKSPKYKILINTFFSLEMLDYYRHNFRDLSIYSW